MTVGQLIEALSKLDPTLEVISEGCDCNGDVDSIMVFDATLSSGEKTSSVLLMRP